MKHLFSMLLAVVVGLAALAIFGEREPKSPPKPATTQSQSALIDINSASTAELMALKGIGEVWATAIIKGRPYLRKDQLVEKKIIPQSVYDGFKDQIIAKQK